jgi:hypothetical protein
VSIGNKVNGFVICSWFGKRSPVRHFLGVYVNIMSGDEEDRVTEAYRERWGRLVAVKTHYDPDNFFRLNQNIPPQKRPEKNY